MADQRFDEKELAKREEKGVDEKEEQRDPISGVAWALFLIWAGVLLLLNNLDRLGVVTDVLDELNIPSYELPVDLPFFNTRAWQAFFLGAGVLVLFEIALRLVMPSYRWNIIGNIIWAGVLFGLALGNWTLIGPLALMAIGVAVLVGGLFRRG